MTTSARLSRGRQSPMQASGDYCSRVPGIVSYRMQLGAIWQSVRNQSIRAINATSS